MIKSILTKAGNQAHYYKYLRPAKLDTTFIVSTGRTGTNFFESFFERIDAHTLSVHEPQPDLFDLGIEKHRNKKNTKIIAETLRAAREPFLRSYCHARTKRYVESNPFLSLLLPEAQQIFPKARFVIITRQAASYMKSALNKSPLDDGSFYAYDDNDRRKRIAATDFEGDPYQDAWSTFSRQERIAWYWNKCNTILMDFVEANPTKTLHLQFEALFSKDAIIRQQTIERLLAFMSIELTNEQLQERLKLMTVKKNQTKKMIFDGVETWTKEEQNKFYELTEKALKKINQL
ncbi:MAG: sulfotransferase domain-containing protein [Aureispira sp.]